MELYRIAVFRSFFTVLIRVLTHSFHDTVVPNLHRVNQTFFDQFPQEVEYIIIIIVAIEIVNGVTSMQILK